MVGESQKKTLRYVKILRKFKFQFLGKNKVYLEDSHLHSFAYAPWLFLLYKGSVKKRHYGLENLKYCPSQLLNG